MSQDHPFSEYLRILGKGPKSRRALTTEEAEQALAMVLAGKVTDKQLGAFLLLMRANGETPAELIGFVKGARNALGIDTDSAKTGLIDLDWSSYAGKWRYPPYYLLAIKLLVQNGFKICLHGDEGQFANRHYSQAFIESLGGYIATSREDAKQRIAQGELVYLPLSVFGEEFKALLHLKEELGVRTVFNTVVKLLNPLNARCAVQGIFHKGVENLHHCAAATAGIDRNMVFKGEGGEAEIRPDALSNLFFSDFTKPTDNPANSEIEKVAFKAISERQRRPQEWHTSHIVHLWDGAVEDDYGVSAVIASAASALMLIKHLSIEAALAEATLYWQQRNL
ncbi:glycosyl transferase family protein [Thiomicrorhabdus sediminis]|uniref:Glycosyl transferase family protein n=1 Tax=Thiomicrorhabdus sediminis TaxID=2580412 RepID=A0A4P9K6Z4_9GAMM|nr:glycosyl transferase family protein [Thiomicrorhabdus sediminis]QCU90230.1 glycosyl transferase family protein [Thiomicrorhabdus sediminis]